MKIQKTSSSTSSKSSNSHHAGNLKSSSTESNQSNHFETNFDTLDALPVDHHRHAELQEDEEIDLNIFVSDLLDQMTSRFDIVGKSILSRVDALGDRIDDLEKNMNELVLSGEGQTVSTGGRTSGGAIGLEAQGETS